MSAILGTIAVRCARRPGLVIGVWLALAVAGVIQMSSLEDKLLAGGFVINDAPSTQVNRVVADEFKGKIGSIFIAVPEGRRGVARTASVARTARRDPDVLAARALVPAARDAPGVVTVTSGLEGSDEPRLVGDLREQLEGTGAKVGGEPAFYKDLVTVSRRDVRKAELIAAPLVIGVLVLIFGSLLAASVSFAVGAAGVCTGMLAIAGLSGLIDVPVYAMNLSILVGLGAGVDYALLMVTRVRDERAAGVEPLEAIRAAAMHAGHAICVSAGAVMLALGGLALTGLDAFVGLAISAGLVLLCVLVAALTLLPALAAVSGDRLLKRRRVTRRPVDIIGPVLALVTRRPWAATIASVTVLLLLALPLLHLRLAQAGPNVFPAGTEARVAVGMIRDALGPGAASPILASVDRSEVGRRELARFQRRAKRTDGVVGVMRLRGPDHTLLTVTYGGSAVSQAGEEAIRHLTAIAPTGVLIGGAGAQRLEEIDQYDARMPLVLGVILLFTMTIIAVAFRSVVLPIKAAAVNLLSVGAVLGVTVFVWQDGNLAGLFGFDRLETGLVTFIPLWVLSVVYGLSMDYEVFLLSRIAEEREAGKPNMDAIVDGTRATSRVITGAAAVMCAVCIPFCMTDMPFTASCGFALMFGVLLDATIVRLVLVPALLTLLGERAWWWPGRKAAPAGASTPGPPQTAAG